MSFPYWHASGNHYKTGSLFTDPLPQKIARLERLAMISPGFNPASVQADILLPFYENCGHDYNQNIIRIKAHHSILAYGEASEAQYRNLLLEETRTSKNIYKNSRFTTCGVPMNKQ